MIEFANLTKSKVDFKIFRTLFKKIFPPAARASKKKFVLSVVFAPPSKMAELNRIYRKKNKAADVLSFLLDKTIGEIFINAEEKDLPRLFVHGCLHLLGMSHNKAGEAGIMKLKEKSILKNA